MNKERILILVGASLWIAGLALSIVGLNVAPPAGRWMAVIGNIVFVLGLLLEGVIWFRRRRQDNEEERRE